MAIFNSYVCLPEGNSLTVFKHVRTTYNWPRLMTPGQGLRPWMLRHHSHRPWWTPPTPGAVLTSGNIPWGSKELSLRSKSTIFRGIHTGNIMEMSWDIQPHQFVAWWYLKMGINRQLLAKRAVLIQKGVGSTQISHMVFHPNKININSARNSANS